VSRVLVLSADRGIPLLGPSGSSAHLRGVVVALGAAGHAVHVATPRAVDKRGAAAALEVQHTTAEPRRWGWVPRRWRDRGELWDARRLVTRALRDFGEPDLIYERHALFCDAGARAAAQLGVPRVVELNAPLALERARYGDLRDRELAAAVERASLRAADRVVAVSGWLARWAIHDAGCDPARVRHVPNGVAARPPGDRDATRSRLGLSGLVIGFLGTMKPWHGADRLLAMLDALPQATLLLAGDGPAPPPAHPRAIALGRVAPADVPDVVAAMDVALAPYAADAPAWFCPLKLLDYRAQGVPIVAADVGDCRALVSDAGEVVPTDDVEAWVAAIERQAARRAAPWLRSWERVVDESLDGLLHP
jgi:glycosyltransferase involved in cell wall biosynthesis